MTVHTCLCNLRFELFQKRNLGSIDDAAPKREFDQNCTSQVDPTPSLTGDPFSLMQLIPFRSTGGKIVELKGGNELQGVVGYFAGTDEAEVDEVLRIAAENKVVAVLVSVRAQNSPLPVFKIQKGFLDSLNRSWKVSIKVLRPIQDSFLESDDGETTNSSFGIHDGNDVTSKGDTLGRCSITTEGETLVLHAPREFHLEDEQVGDRHKVDANIRGTDDGKDRYSEEKQVSMGGSGCGLSDKMVGEDFPFDVAAERILLATAETKANPLSVDGVFVTSDCRSGEEFLSGHCGDDSDAFSVDGSVLAKDHTDNRSYAAAAASGLDRLAPDGITEYKPVSQEVAKPNSFGAQVMGFVNAQVMGIASAISPWPKSVNWGDILASAEGWTASKEFEAYKTFSTKVRKLVSDGKEQELVEMASEVHRFLCSTKGMLLQLALAARLTLICRSNALDDLALVVLRQLSELEPITKNQFSQFNFVGDELWNPAPTIFLFLNCKFTSLPELSNSDDLILNLFWIWNDCGLFARTDRVDWKRIRSQVDEGFGLRMGQNLIRLMNQKHADLLRLGLCRSLEGCEKTLMKLEEERGHIPSIDEQMIGLVFTMVEANVNEQATDPNSFRNMLATVHSILKQVVFAPQGRSFERQLRSRFISKVVSLASFHKFRFFHNYLQIIDVACPTHRDYDFWITAVKKSIGNDIAQFTNLQLSDLTSLITADSFNRIWDKATFDAVISCSRRLMQQHGRLYEKISFIGKLHRSLASATHFNSTHGLFCLWESAFKVETARIVVLESCLKAAVSQPDIFKGPQDFVKRLCIVALTFDDGEFFLSNPDKLATSLAVVSFISDGAFHSALWERLTEVISASFGSISDAGYFYMKIIHHEASSAALVELATTLFTREFYRWCPGSFRELAEQESGRLCIIFQCLTSDRAPYTIHKADVMECNKRLKTLVTNWLEDFRSDTISLSDLSHVRSCCSTACWNEIADFMSTDLPSEEEFCLKSDDFDRMLELIAQSISLQGSTSSSVQDVLKGYNCFFDPSTQLGRIFSDYSFLLVQQAAHLEATRERFAELNIMLRDVRDAATCVGAFRQRYDTEIHLCHYFLKNSSLLFSRALSVALERKVDVETLAVALAGAKDSIKSLFSPDADHEQVDEATRFIVDAVGTLERELAVLRASMELELTDAGVLRFELISLLTSLERPLQGFITFCQHVKFAFVDCDPSFNELKEVNELVLERKNAPEDILGRLLRILCPKLSDVADLKSVREHLHWRLPALQVVSNLSMNIEVWILAREMEWIGKDGIKRFHDEYANVTNVLLGSKQEMFELAVLDSLGVTIPVVGLVGSLMETTMLAKFLDGLTNNEFIASCHADSDFKDIKQVQCNISSIRDWFTNGVDEIAAVYGLFEAVKSTGEYLIMERDEDEGGLNHELVLRYMMENNGSLELKSMTGKVFPGHTFVILHADHLEGRLMELLLSFFSSPETGCAGIRLHCVQGRGSILHTAPWVDGKTWDATSLDLLTLRNDAELHPWRSLIADRGINLSVVCSEISGSGKSRHIKDIIKCEKTHDAETQIGSITLHEGTTIRSLVDNLVLCFSPALKKKAVHFSFTHMPERHSGSSRWLDDVNHFFSSVLILGCVHDPSSSISFRLGQGQWKIFVELPSENGVFAGEWLWRHIPVLAICGTFDEPSKVYAIDNATRRVCTYLRAFGNGTINRKFKSSAKRIVFVLDVSGSMSYDVGGGKSALMAAKENAIQIFDSHVQPGDTFGVITFDNCTYVPVQSQQVTDELHKVSLRNDLHLIHHYGGGTNMYAALQFAVNSVLDSQELESWIVCLTDGMTADSDCQLRLMLSHYHSHLHLVVIGVNLDSSYENQMRLLCCKYRPDQPTKGFFLSTNTTHAAINEAFQTVASRIPVSQTFELDGLVSDDECRTLLEKYSPQSLPKGDMLLQSFWVRFLYRRVKVFDENESFNYNEKYDQMGSSLMEAMLEEAKRLIDCHHSHDWSINHTQLIYDFHSGTPEFRLICTSPDTLNPKVRENFERLDLPGFRIPTTEQLRQRNTLDRFLSQAIGVPLQNIGGTDTLRCIDDTGFILTLDFTMKLLNIHERIASRVPCIIEGETGVSKTALTKMYAILRNSALRARAEDSTRSDLLDVCQSLQEHEASIDLNENSLNNLRRVLQEASEQTIGNETELAGRVHELIREKCQMRSALFQRVPPEFAMDENARTKSVAAFLDWFGKSELEPTFFEINVDSSQTESDIVFKFEEIRASARKLLVLKDALVVVFLDEVNTSSVMGMFKEIVIDRSIQGEALEENIVVVAACNPHRGRLAVQFFNQREHDLGRDWASGHYQVAPLPASMSKLKWAFGALNKDQENEFVFRRLEIAGSKMNHSRRMIFASIIAESQDAVRVFAERNIRASMNRMSLGLHPNSKLELEEDAGNRAKSVVSLRDIQRVFGLYEFFLNNFNAVSSLDENAMILAIATVYFLRLDSECRKDFLSKINALTGNAAANFCLQSVLDAAMDVVVKETEIPRGIAVTRGLKENIFMTLVCSLSQTPLIIVGPPGSSKTLSVNVVSDNANGDDSVREFFRRLARLSIFHYQCSKQSTSKEIASVFEKASQRQEKVDAAKHRCVVFMDEAGLPEEEKESLKVLHYLLEGHMSTKAKVGFVGISNHALDAAKSNRCVTLLRQEPDDEEMLSITTGVLFLSGSGKTIGVSQVALDDNLFSMPEFSSRLASTYKGLLHDKVHFDWFESFFGLRDYIHFLKALRIRGSLDTLHFRITMQEFVVAVERNFNGIEQKQLQRICCAFLEKLTNRGCLQLTSLVGKNVRHPTDVLVEATKADNVAHTVSERTRFKLIIDCTEDDSIMRLLGVMGVVELNSKSLFMLSNMPEDKELEQLRLVSGVKFAALQGKLAVLSQTEAVNECFYDLFNQHFRMVQGRNVEMSLFANIAVGGVSRRSQVKQEFSCIVHIRESQMDKMPAPFLNRFEKFRLKTSDVLSGRCRLLGNLSNYMMKAHSRVNLLVATLGRKGLFGFVDGQTIDSIFISMLPDRATPLSSVLMPSKAGDTREARSFPELFCLFLSEVMSQLHDIRDHVSAVIEDARNTLPTDLCNLLVDIVKLPTVEGGFIRECFASLSTGSNQDDSRMGKLLASLFQMVVTRIAAFRLMQIATPEAVFFHRAELPPDLVRVYFAQQEHFSLKKLIAKAEKSALASKDTNMFIACTRSDAVINRIPSYSTSGGGASLEIVKAIVHDNTDSVVVEHLEALRSEARLRSSVIAWIQNPQHSIYVLIVDMGKEGAIGRTNFVRMFLEQVLGAKTGKVVALLLHFPRSSASSYPSLFLGNWQHVFLDGVGQIECDAGIVSFIEAACSNLCELDSFRHNTNNELDKVTERLQLMLPRMLSHITTKQILHSDQVKKMATGFGKKIDSYAARYDVLLLLLKKRVGGHAVGKLLCEKFGKLWLQSGLKRTMKRASEKLLDGTTNLPLSMSLQSSLLETFDTYLSLQLCEMNRHRNLDVILQEVVSQEAEALFGLILRGLPVPPFDEIVLRRRESCVVRGIFFTDNRDPEAFQFPFFDFISSCLTEVVESSLKEVSQSVVDANGNGVDEYCAAVYARSVEVLHIEESDQSIQSQKRKSVSQAVDYVKAVGPSLFSIYLDRFIEKITGKAANSTTADWVQSETRRMGYDNDMLAAHVTFKVQESQLMSVASWATRLKKLDTRLFELSNSSVTQVVGGMGSLFFNALLDHFEHSLTGLDMSRCEWSRTFSLFFHQSHSMLGQSEIQDVTLIRRLRALSFFYILISSKASAEIEANLLQRWYDKTSNELLPEALENPSLHYFAQISRVDQSHDLFHMLLRLFLSETWMNLTTTFRRDDFSFLIQMISTGALAGLNFNKSVALLQMAFWSFGSPSNSTVLGIPYEPLQLVANNIASDASLEFDENGQLTSVSHYVPHWLQRRSQPPVPAEDTRCNDFLSVFLRDCTPRFNGGLSRVVFDVMLRSGLDQMERLSSDSLLLLLLADVEAETGCTRQELTRFARVRAAAGVWESFKGTPVASIGIAVRLTCFVAKVAYELACKGQSLALSGNYSNSSRRLLEGLMSVECLCWDDFFVGTILRIRGEGSFAELLKPGGALAGFEWCKKWTYGEPALMESIASQLAKAERELAEAISEEERKLQEFRLCPHCNREFVIRERNCGTFVCGRDYHSGNQTFGCGQTFHLDNAQHYTANEQFLAPLRRKVQEEGARLQTSHHGAVLWKRARDFAPPVVNFFAFKSRTHDPILPTAYVVSLYDQEDNAAATDLSVFRLLEQSTTLFDQLRVLPDLIEFYLWLHSTLKYLVTKEGASCLPMNNVVTKERLRSRFDLVHADHVEGLWFRVKDGFNNLLQSMDHILHWQCDAIQFPFEKFEHASLIHFLSQGNDPSEGNDFLFLMIHEIVDNYNTFVRRLSDLKVTIAEVESDSLVHPKFLVSGNGGASLISAVPVLSRSELKNLAESGWDENSGTFDLNLLRNLLCQQRFLDGLPPSIMNPCKYLRETFIFRDETDTNASRHQQAGGVSKSVDGSYFANSQDFSLFSDVLQLLEAFELPAGNGNLNRTFNDHFFAFSYVQLRSALEGVRNILQMLQTSGETCIGSVEEALCRATNLSKEELVLTSQFVLSQMGFPDFGASQSQLILSLSETELRDYVHFLGYQLATEAYIFASLPLCMTEPLSEPDFNTITEGLRVLYKDDGLVRTEDRLEEFVRDVLSYYEIEISKRALSSDQQLLKVFLMENNCCDESDPIYSLLPNGLTVRNFISLRQLFHQTRLEMRFEDEANLNAEIDVSEKRQVENAVCWFWNEQQRDPENHDMENDPSQDSFNEGLWFERPAVVDLETVEREANARKIQKWWRLVEAEMRARCQEIAALRSQGDRMDWEVGCFDVEDFFQLPSMDIDVAGDGSAAHDVDRWTYESLYLGKSGSKHDGESTSHEMHLYGRTDNEIELRRWLNDHRLPQSTGDFLAEMGVRDIDDVCRFLDECDPEDLRDIPRLDLIKLKRAVKSYREEPKVDSTKGEPDGEEPNDSEP